MCLAIPGKIEQIEGKKAVVDFGGIKRKVDLSFVDEVNINDWVLVHVGFAIQTVEEDIARESYRLLSESRGEELQAELKQA